MMPPDIEQQILDWPLCKEFNLPPNANIVVVGAYQGKVMETLARLYPEYGWILGFEPQIWAANAAKERLAGFPLTSVRSFGLGAKTITEAPMGEWHTDACSFVNTGPYSREQGIGRIQEASEILTSETLVHIDLLVMNIEGGEYELIPHLRSTGWLSKISRLAVQWHIFPEHEMNEDRVQDEIDHLIVVDDFLLRYDQRPTWTYFFKDLD